MSMKSVAAIGAALFALAAMAESAAAAVRYELFGEGRVTISGVDNWCWAAGECTEGVATPIGTHVDFYLRLDVDFDDAGVAHVSNVFFDGSNFSGHEYEDGSYTFVNRHLVAGYAKVIGGDRCGLAASMDFADGQFTFMRRRCEYEYDIFPVFEDEGSGRITRVLRDGVAVPEPATWALMILGFGAAGSALRRRRAQTA